jgi:hypothetical protein
MASFGAAKGEGPPEGNVSVNVARLLGCPLPGRVRGHPGQIDLSCGELDEDEHVEPAQEHGLDGEEIAGDHAAGLRSQEGPPGLR